MPTQVSEEEYARMALANAQGNHIWLSALSCIKPSDEFIYDLGRSVLSLLNNKDNLIPGPSITSDNETARELAELTPYIFIAINKS